MFKKILIIIGYIIITAAAGGYFYFAYHVKAQNSPKVTCNHISVKILDSTQNRFVSKDEVLNILAHYSERPLGRSVESIDLNAIEKLLDKRSAIKQTQAYIGIDGDLKVDILQRRPIIRIETENGGFYVDENGYIFPLEYNFTSYVPIVSGNIPLAIDTSYRGFIKTNEEWIEKILNLGLFIDKNEFWNNQIEQIYIDDNGEIKLSPRTGPQTIYFGDLSNIENKFARLYAYYKDIVPVHGNDKYSAVSLKYKNQIICKKIKID